MSFCHHDFPGAELHLLSPREKGRQPTLQLSIMTNPAAQYQLNTGTQTVNLTIVHQAHDVLAAWLTQCRIAEQMLEHGWKEYYTAPEAVPFHAQVLYVLERLWQAHTIQTERDMLVANAHDALIFGQDENLIMVSLSGGRLTAQADKIRWQQQYDKVLASLHDGEKIYTPEAFLQKKGVITDASKHA